VRAILMVSCLSVAFAQVLPAQGAPQAPWGIDLTSTTPIRVPADIRRLVGADLEYDETELIKGVVVDLGGDGIDDYLLQSAPSLCGNGGCIYVLCDGATRKKLGQFFGSSIYVSAERVRGYPNIATYSRQSAQSASYIEYRFDGSGYVVASARTVEGAALNRLLETLRPVQIWRPRR
jgi:hypothetical protein